MGADEHAVETPLQDNQIEATVNGNGSALVDDILQEKLLRRRKYADEEEEGSSVDDDDDDDSIRSSDEIAWVLDGKNSNPRPRLRRRETMSQFVNRQYHNIVHFFVEDWFLSAALGIVTAMLSIAVDIGIEVLLLQRLHFYDYFSSLSTLSGFCYWILHYAVCISFAALFCKLVSAQAVGSGIPEVKVIISGFPLKNYLSLKTLIAKVVGLTFTLGGGFPVGKEGPFVHMGAIVASLLTRVTSSCRYNQFFSNEGREMEMLSSGCAVGIACTFSAPAGGVLYGIESTSKYFAVKNYWRSFFATTCSALVFRFAMNFIVPPEIAGTITAYYQTKFPNEVFVIEELPFFILLGAFCGLAGAFFIYLHRTFSQFMARNKIYRALFGKSPIVYTCLIACIVALITYPEGVGRYIAGKLTFRETLSDFVSNCTYLVSPDHPAACKGPILAHWTGGDFSHGTNYTLGELDPFITLSCYFLIYYLLVAQCICLFLPTGIFVPCFVMGACAGRLLGEVVAWYWPTGMRDQQNLLIYPGLYAVVGAAAYTGAVTHSLSIAVIVCETTGQLCALLPVLIALMVANAICSFLQPSIYESIIMIKNLPFLTDLPPSRISVHTLKVEKVMVKEIFFISRKTTYKELRELLQHTENLRSYPLVTDNETMSLLGSVSRKYLSYLLLTKLGFDPALHTDKRRSRTASELMSTLHNIRRGSTPAPPGATLSPHAQHYLTDRQLSGNTLLKNSPLHSDAAARRSLVPLINRHEHNDATPHSMAQRALVLVSPIKIDDAAIDPAPFQLVKGTSLYKVHTLFSLLGLNHAYVTDRGRLVGVVSLKELRETFANIYLRGALPIKRRPTLTKSTRSVLHDDEAEHELQRDSPSTPDPSSA